MVKTKPRGHIVKSFDNDMGGLDATVMHMGNLALAQLDDSLKALLGDDDALAERVIQDDNKIDRCEDEIFNDATRILALRQPMADDLRRVIGAIRVANDIERIGDHAENNAKRSIQHPGGITGAQITNFEFLAQLARQSLCDALAAYAARDPNLAIMVCVRDDRIDDAYTSLFRNLLTYMMEDPRNITGCSHLLMVAKNLERIGDHATNIAETAYFIRLGRRMEAPGIPSRNVTR